MTTFSKSDLQRKNYSWSAIREHDNAEIIGFPDDKLIDADEGYEVLPFIRRFLRWHKRGGQPLTVADGHIVERGLQKKPGAIRSHEKVKQWILDNWAAI